jgi:hypothetical protein
MEGGREGCKKAGRLNNPFGGDPVVCFLALGGEVTPAWNVRRFARKNNHKVIKIIIIIMSGFLPPCPSSSEFQSKKNNSNFEKMYVDFVLQISGIAAVTNFCQLFAQMIFFKLMVHVYSADSCRY